MANDEVICRGAYFPTHFTGGKTPKLRAAFIERRMLVAGELSVWRLAPEKDPQTLLPKLVRDNRELRAVHGVRAEEVRKLQGDGKRQFSVLNDTRTDDVGGHDPEHATISPCRSYLKQGLDEGAVEQLVNALMLTFRERILWQSAA